MKSSWTWRAGRVTPSPNKPSPNKPYVTCISSTWSAQLARSKKNPFANLFFSQPTTIHMATTQVFYLLFPSRLPVSNNVFSIISGPRAISSYWFPPSDISSHGSCSRASLHGGIRVGILVFTVNPMVSSTCLASFTGALISYAIVCQ
jgi:hypothetical protein